MATKSFDTALDFLPEAKSVRNGAGAMGVMGVLKAVVEAFDEGRTAEARYHDLVARGVSHEAAARKVFEISTKH